jgi:hypothetical protein
MGKGKVIERFLDRIIRAGTRILLGSDATGDIYYRNASGNLTRLGIGTTGQVLGVNSGLPAWQTSPSSGAAYTIVAKSADETLAAGSTTLQTDDHLSFSVEANSVYEGVLCLRIQKSAYEGDNGLRTLLLIPSIETYSVVPNIIVGAGEYNDDAGQRATIGISTSVDNGKAGMINGAEGAWNTVHVYHSIGFTFKTGSIPGTAQLYTCIKVSNTANWTIKQGSFIKYCKVL